MLKTIHQFRAGDIVCYLGAKFRVLEDAKESQAHRPQRDHLMTAHGPSDCAWAPSEWIEGTIEPGYFGPNDLDWTFQGNHRAGLYKVI